MAPSKPGEQSSGSISSSLDKKFIPKKTQRPCGVEGIEEEEEKKILLLLHRLRSLQKRIENVFDRKWKRCMPMRDSLQVQHFVVVLEEKMGLMVGWDQCVLTVQKPHKKTLTEEFFG